MMPYSVASSHDFSEYIYVANLVDELPLNMMSRHDLQQIICTELAGVEKFRFEDDIGAVWLTAFVKFYTKEAADFAVQRLNTHDKIGAATVTSLFELYSELEDFLRSKYTGYCAFSFIIVEQVNMSLTPSEMISLFTNYGPVKIAKMAPPMCIGYERFTEALAAKIDQNRWNNAGAYISVKIFPRMKEQVLGFLKARMNHSSSERNIHDIFSVCMICDRCARHQTYRESNEVHTDGENCNQSSKTNQRTQDTIVEADNTRTTCERKNISDLGLSFDPNDFVFYLRIESKAFANLNKQSRCDSSSSDTGISSEGSSRATYGSEPGNDVMDNTLDSLSNYVSHISLGKEDLSDMSSSGFQNHNESSEVFTPVENYDFMEQPISYTYDSFRNPDIFTGATSFVGGCAYPQWTYDYSSPAFVTDSYTQDPFNSECLPDGQHPYLYANYSNSSSTPRSPEIEKNFKLYGMKMRTKHSDNDPKIILIPFVYYNGNEKDKTHACNSKMEVKTEYSSVANSQSLKCLSKTASTKQSFSETINAVAPVLNEANFPTLQEAKGNNYDKLKSKNRNVKHKLKFRENMEKSFTQPSVTVSFDNKFKVCNETQSNCFPNLKLNKKKNEKILSESREHIYQKEERVPQNKTLRSSCGIKLVFSNKSKSSSAHFKKYFPVSKGSAATNATRDDNRMTMTSRSSKVSENPIHNCEGNCNRKVDFRRGNSKYFRDTKGFYSTSMVSERTTGSFSNAEN